jgi:hypothetical protein
MGAGLYFSTLFSTFLFFLTDLPFVSHRESTAALLHGGKS